MGSEAPECPGEGQGSLVLVALGLLALPVSNAGAETVLEKISRTRTLTAGTRTSSIPFAYINEKKEWVGFSVDLIKEIHRHLEREMAEKITLELKEVTPETRIFQVANRTIDFECGSTVILFRLYPYKTCETVCLC